MLSEPPPSSQKHALRAQKRAFPGVVNGITPVIKRVAGCRERRLREEISQLTIELPSHQNSLPGRARHEIGTFFFFFF